MTRRGKLETGLLAGLGKKDAARTDDGDPKLRETSEEGELCYDGQRAR